MNVVKIMILFLSLSLISCGQLLGDKTGANDLPEVGDKPLVALMPTILRLTPSF